MQKPCAVCGKTFKSRIDSRQKTPTKCCSKACRDIYLSKFTKEGLPKVDEFGRLLCYTCKNYKLKEEFYLRDDYEFTPTREGRGTQCKECSVKVGKEKELRNKYDLKHVLMRRLISARTSSKKRHIEYDKALTYLDLLEIYDKQDGRCALSGEPLMITEKKSSNTISLDRINSDLGYTKSNVHLVCWVVNQMKNDLTLLELNYWCTKILTNGKTLDSRGN